MVEKQVVITGVGVVAPGGIGKDAFWEGLSSGEDGFRNITLFDTQELKVKVGGQIDNFNPQQILEEKRLIDLDRATLLLLSSAKLALADSNLEINEDNTYRTGVCVGTTFGSLHSISKFNREAYTEGPRYVNPSIFPSTVGNSPASRVSIKFKVKGFNSTISTGVCAALDAIDYARDAINLNKVDAVLVGSVEDLAIQTFLGFYKLKYLSGLDGKGEPKSCPFDKRRDGIVFSEGSTTLIFQDINVARKQKRHIYGEVLGVGSCFDPARFYRYNPNGEGFRKAMQLALEDAKLKPGEIDCVFANANSTKDADLGETLAIKGVFGNYAYKVPVVGIKAMLGESLSASGGLATVAALGALEQGIIPATINYQQKDKACDLDYVPNQSRKQSLSKVMINAFDPNGANTSIIIGKHKEG